MKRTLGCAAFIFLGVAWLLFTFWDLFVHTFGDCGDDRFCVMYKQTVGGLVFWRGLAVALLLGIAYALYRRFFEDEDV